MNHPCQPLKTHRTLAGVLGGLGLLLFVSGCVTPHAGQRAPATLEGEVTRPEAASWARTELYFALRRVDELAPSPDRDPPATRGAASLVSEEQWRAFLDAEVTPRFPDGLSVFDAYGQWRSRARMEPSRLFSRVLVILHPDTPAQRALLDEIRVAWKTATGHQSVLLVSQPAAVSF